MQKVIGRCWLQVIFLAKAILDLKLKDGNQYIKITPFIPVDSSLLLGLYISSKNQYNVLISYLH